MTTANGEEALKCSIGTLMMIYYVVVGLAITEALQNAFHKDGSFLGATAFSAENLPKTILLLTLLLTICHFVHGSSLHLGVPSDKRYKPLVDFVYFFLQASMFYLMALSLQAQSLFLGLFVILLISDMAWLGSLVLIGYLKFDPMTKSWLITNSLTIGVLIGILLIRECTTNTVGASIILVVTALDTVWDYVGFKDFYFPSR